MSELRFLGYEVSRLSFQAREINDTAPDGERIEYEPVFHREVVSLEEGHHVLKLSVSIGSDNDKLPFIIMATLEGHFLYDDQENKENAMKGDATAILFPYLRASVAHLTVLANISQLTLPTFNIAEMFHDKEPSAG